MFHFITSVTLVYLLFMTAPMIQASTNCESFTTDITLESYSYECLARSLCVNHTHLVACQSLLTPVKRLIPNLPAPSSFAVWGYGLLAVTIINMTSVFGVVVFPFMDKSFYNRILTVLIGLAVGSLCSSSLFHLLPAAFKLAAFGEFQHHSYLYVSLVVLGGVYLFFLIERFLKIYMEYKSRNEGVIFGAGHSHGDPASNDSMQGTCNIDENSPKIHEVYEQSIPAMKASFGHMEKPVNSPRPGVMTDLANKKHSRIATVAWMIIFGDGMHNFIDGLSIGAGFTESTLTGVSISIAVFCEEFPHELGDFAVLLSAGMKIKEALMYNFLSACTCYVGLIIGIVLGELHTGNEYIFAVAGGMFLYISLVDMMPELNETMDKSSSISVREAFLTFTLQNAGLLFGIFFLFFLALYQDYIQI